MTVRRGWQKAPIIVIIDDHIAVFLLCRLLNHRHIIIALFLFYKILLLVIVVINNILFPARVPIIVRFRALVAQRGDLRISYSRTESDFKLFVQVGVAQPQVKIRPIALMVLEFIIIVILLRCQA